MHRSGTGLLTVLAEGWCTVDADWVRLAACLAAGAAVVEYRAGCCGGSAVCGGDCGGWCC